MEGLIPIRNFGILEDGKLYRSAQPQFSYEYKWLENLGVKLIINLREECKRDEVYAPKFNMKTIQYNIKDHHCPTRAEAEEFMYLIKEAKEPILFHCEHGRGRTSTFSVLARLAQGWKLEDALKEEKDKFGYEFQHSDQINFLNSF